MKKSEAEAMRSQAITAIWGQNAEIRKQIEAHAYEQTTEIWKWYNSGVWRRKTPPPPPAPKPFEVKL